VENEKRSKRRTQLLIHYLLFSMVILLVKPQQWVLAHIGFQSYHVESR
jgi:hypothetical protein